MKQTRFRARAGWYNAKIDPCSKADGKYYFRSKLEAVFARYLNMGIKAGDITSWEHEPETFMLTDKKGFNTRYKPDFKMIMVEPKQDYYVEVKGFLRPDGDRKKLKMASFQLPAPLKVFTKDCQLMPVEDYLEAMKPKKLQCVICHDPTMGTKSRSGEKWPMCKPCFTKTQKEMRIST